MRRRNVNPRRNAVVRWTGMVCIVAGASALANEPSLDELLGLEPSSETPPSEAETPTDPNEDPASVTGEITETLQGPSLTENFELAVAEMTEITEQLDATETGLPTQRLQQRVLDRLDQLIAAAASSPPPPSSGSGSSGQGQPRDGDNQQNQPGEGEEGQQGNAQQPGQGQQASQGQSNSPSEGAFSPGSAQDPETGERSLDEVRSEWGVLPPRLRDALTDGLDEPYSPIYRDATEAYYRQLAEEAGQ
ncbi:MAG: hypothetical protein AAGF84_09395 [Planctomycetota bacterium]